MKKFNDLIFDKLLDSFLVSKQNKENKKLWKKKIFSNPKFKKEIMKYLKKQKREIGILPHPKDFWIVEKEFNIKK